MYTPLKVGGPSWLSAGAGAGAGASAVIAVAYAKRTLLVRKLARSCPGTETSMGSSRTCCTQTARASSANSMLDVTELYFSFCPVKGGSRGRSGAPNQGIKAVRQALESIT